MEVIEEAILMSKVFSGFDLVTGLGLFLSSCAMIYGIKKENDRFLLPIIYYIPIDGAFRYLVIYDINGFNIRITMVLFIDLFK